MKRKICHPGTTVPIVTGNLQVDSNRDGQKKARVSGQAPGAAPAQPFGPQLPGNAAPAIPVPADGFGKTITVTRTPAGAPRLRNEDATGAVTRHHIGKGASLAPKMPAATALGGVHRTPRGAAGATAPQRPLRRTTVDG